MRLTRRQKAMMVVAFFAAAAASGPLHGLTGLVGSPRGVAAGVASEAEEGAQPRGKIASPCRGRSVTVRVPRSKYPHIVDHIEDTWRAGHPRVVRLNRRGAEERRERLTDWYEDRYPQPAGDGLDLDERPMAILRSTWRGHIRPINQKENRSEGSSVGGQLRGVPNGTCVRYDFGG